AALPASRRRYRGSWRCWRRCGHSLQRVWCRAFRNLRRRPGRVRARLPARPPTDCGWRGRAYDSTCAGSLTSLRSRTSCRQEPGASVDFHLDSKLRLKTEPEYKNLYKWAINEVDPEGRQIGRDQIPWEWTFYFTATSCVLSDSLDVSQPLSLKYSVRHD